MRIKYLIKNRNISEFSIESGDKLSEVIIKSIDNNVLINKLKNIKKTEKFTSKIVGYTEMLKDFICIILIGFETYEANLMECCLKSKYKGLSVFIIDSHYIEFTNTVKFK